MKILNRKDFLNAEPPVLYHKYSPTGDFGELCIKLSSPKEDWGNDWIYQDLAGWPKGVSNTEEYMMTMAQFENGSEIMFDLEMGERDGLFEEDELFAVYDWADIEQLINKLQSVFAKQRAAHTMTLKDVGTKK